MIYEFYDGNQTQIFVKDGPVLSNLRSLEGYGPRQSFVPIDEFVPRQFKCEQKLFSIQRVAWILEIKFMANVPFLHRIKKMSYRQNVKPTALYFID